MLLKTIFVSHRPAAVAVGLAIGSVFLAQTSMAAEHAPRSRVASLMNQILGDIKGKIVRIVSVDYAGGAAGKPHRHPGHVFVYVAKGAIFAQVGDGPRKRYTRGQVFYEAPMMVHKVSANVSKTAPAQVIAFIVIDEKNKVVLPAK